MRTGVKAAIVGTVTFAMCLAGCSSSSAPASSVPPTNPAKGAVVVLKGPDKTSIEKMCDGSTLIYYSFIDGYDEGFTIAVVPKSPEC